MSKARQGNSRRQALPFRLFLAGAIAALACLAGAALAEQTALPFDIQKIFKKRPVTEKYKAEVKYYRDLVSKPCNAPPFVHAEKFPFGPGEDLSYKAYALGVYAGRVQVWLGEVDPGNNTIPIRMSAETNSFFSKIKRLTGRQSSFVDLFTLYPVHVVADSRIDDARRGSNIYFYRDQRKMRSSIIRNKRQFVEEAAIDPHLYDPLSALLQLRLRELRPNEEMCLEYVFDRQIWQVRGKVVGDEWVSVPAGRFHTQVLQGLAVRKDSPYLSSRRKDVRLWITGDARRLPVKAASKLVLGQVALELENYTPPKSPLSWEKTPAP